ncbi:MAG TPA: hypothetical protein VM715_08325 [Candidatus Acidoferrum sp.]|jgi:hypothetical protein|nr:hypothetical protein [Candidatus Acidoferrum sp.]
MRFVREQFFMAAAAQSINDSQASFSDNAYYGSCDVADVRTKNSPAAIIAAEKNIPIADLFNTHSQFIQMRGTGCRV